jgi:aspartate/methionine/tyrosine aminotransferase
VSNIATHYAINYVLVPENMRAIELENAAEIRAAYFVLTSTLLEHQIHFYEAHAGIFVFAQLCPNASQESERQFGIALKNQGLVLASGTSYHFSEPGWFRICYAVSHEILQEGLDRLLLCIQESRLSPVPM